nr:uncharacterized protein LOC101058264 isoform X2 [Pan troglodytes]
MPGKRLVCRLAHGHFPRKGQRRRSLTVWKAETSRADCLGAPLGRSEKRTAICFSTGAQDSSQRAPFRLQNPGQLLQTSVRNLVPSILHTSYHAIFNPRTWVLLGPCDIWGPQGPEKGRKITHAGTLSPQVKLPCFSPGEPGMENREAAQRQETQVSQLGSASGLLPLLFLQLGMHSLHLHPELPTTDPAFSCKLHFIKGKDPYCLTISHVKSVLTFSQTWDIVSAAHTPIIFMLSTDRSICLPVTL